MTTQKFRELCEEIMIPLITGALEHQLIDIHDMLDISATELVRIGERLDDINAHLSKNDE